MEEINGENNSLKYIPTPTKLHSQTQGQPTHLMYEKPTEITLKPLK